MRKTISSLTLLLLVSMLASQVWADAGESPPSTSSDSGAKKRSIYTPLVSYLTEQYSTLAMPVCTNNTAMNVKMDLWLYQLFDLDEPTQMLTIDVWMEMTWHDCGLTWNPANFSGISQIALPAGEIWHPDLIFYQSLHGNFEEGMFLFPQSVARIRNDGAVQLGSQGLLKIFCRINIVKFPFDTQTCNITFASWNKDASVFRLTKRDSHSNPRGHSFSAASNGEWDVIGFPSFDQSAMYSVGADGGGPLEYTEVVFQLELRRKPTYVKVYLIFPCILLVWVSAITFILPVECGEKIGMSVTVLLSLIVFLLLVADNIPRTSDGIPTLGIFFSLSVGLVCLSVVMTSLVLNVGLKTQEIAMPHCFKQLMRHSGTRVLCFRYSNTTPRHKWLSLKVRNKKNGVGKKDKEQQASGHDVPMCADGERVDLGERDACPPGTCDRNDWRYLAILLDRLFMIIYILLAAILTIYIYASEPTYTDV